MIDGTCQQLLARLDELADDEQRAQLIADHIATCPQCLATETMLAALSAEYRRDEPPPLAPERERRMLDFLCGLSKGKIPPAEP